MADAHTIHRHAVHADNGFMDALEGKPHRKPKGFGVTSYDVREYNRGYRNGTDQREQTERNNAEHSLNAY